VSAYKLDRFYIAVEELGLGALGCGLRASSRRGKRLGCA
jgi:hypothetical protein